MTDISARHAETTDPRSIASAAAIAKRLWHQCIDTRVGHKFPNTSIHYVRGKWGAYCDTCGWFGEWHEKRQSAANERWNHFYAKCTEIERCGDLNCNGKLNKQGVCDKCGYDW